MFCFLSHSRLLMLAGMNRTFAGCEQIAGCIEQSLLSRWMGSSAKSATGVILRFSFLLFFSVRIYISVITRRLGCKCLALLELQPLTHRIFNCG
jgi:hypothetical protein